MKFFYWKKYIGRLITSVSYIFKSVYNMKINKNHNRNTRKYKVIARKKIERVLFIHAPYFKVRKERIRAE